MSHRRKRQTNKLYELRRRRGVLGVDEVHGVVVKAPDVETARRLAAREAMDEGEAVWLDSRWSYCRPIRLDGRPRTIILDRCAV